MFEDVKVGDTVLRLLSDQNIPMHLKVTAVDDRLIHCGPWTFDRGTGVEEDEELGWGVKFGRTGSRLAAEGEDA